VFPTTVGILEASTGTMLSPQRAFLSSASTVDSPSSDIVRVQGPPEYEHRRELLLRLAREKKLAWLMEDAQEEPRHTAS
jgi:hypothetical protein